MFYELRIDLLLIWIAFCVVHGIYEAVMYSKQDMNDPVKLKRNAHYWAFPLRIIVAFSICYVPNFDLGVLLKDLIALAVVLPFFHNGAYYFARGSFLDKVKGYSFFGKSGTTTAKMNFGFIYRVIGLLIGILMWTDLGWLLSDHF